MTHSTSSNPGKVLILGAGLVTRPIVRYLLDNGFNVTVATRTVSKAEALVGGRPGGTALAFDIDDETALSKLTLAHDLTVSLLPATHHVKVARACLAAGRHLVTTSYVSEEMRSLDSEVVAKGLLFLNELGLDPGIDHMSAMKVIHEVREKGGKVVEFSSYCGGLPAPEANDNPWGYKFSWAPRGVLIAATNGARYLKGGKLVDVAGKDLFKHSETLEVAGMRFEAYPNRNSMGYIDLYGLHSLKTMFRATLRNPGHCSAWLKLVSSGLLGLDREMELKGVSRREFLGRVLGCSAGEVESTLMNRFNVQKDDPFMLRLDFIGLFSDAPVGMDRAVPLDAMAHMMSEAMIYKNGERDMCVLHHSFTAEYPNRVREMITSTLVDFGIPHGDTSMSRGVSLPPAVAVKLILNGKIDLKGVRIPVDREIYVPILRELEELGIKMTEEWHAAV